MYHLVIIVIVLCTICVSGFISPTFNPRFTNLRAIEPKSISEQSSANIQTWGRSLLTTATVLYPLAAYAKDDSNSGKTNKKFETCMSKVSRPYKIIFL